MSVPRTQSGSQPLGLMPTTYPRVEGPEEVNRGQAHGKRPLRGRKQLRGEHRLTQPRSNCRDQFVNTEGPYTVLPEALACEQVRNDVVKASRIPFPRAGGVNKAVVLLLCGQLWPMAS